MRHPGFAARYHQETKHHPHRYARSSGFMDWPNQPEPFLRYAGAALTLLPLSPADEGPSYASLYAGGAIPPVTFNLCSLGALLQYAMGLSAWKEYQGARWELRCNPSSGNLHPTECYVAAPALEGLSDTPCVYHYAPKEHGLECRCTYQKHMWESLTAKHPEVFCFIGFTSIHWREAWKYGERAYRYCQLDAGHAFAALDYSAAALGWRAVLLEGMGDDDVAALLGCTRDEDRDPAEQERAEALLAIVPANHAEPIPAALPEDMLGKIAAATWHGRPEPLSKHHAPWEIIDAVSEACIKPATSAAPSNARA